MQPLIVPPALFRDAQARPEFAKACADGRIIPNGHCILDKASLDSQQREPRDRPALRGESFAEDFQHALDKTAHLIERANDLHSRDWRDVGKNYADGKLAIYLRMNATGGVSVGRKDEFAFLIGSQMIEFGGAERESVASQKTAIECEGLREQAGIDPNQVFPMLILIGDFVDGPEGVIPSGVWFLGEDKIPLVRREFLFESIMSGGWKWLSLPIGRRTPEGEAYARCAPAIGIDKGDNHLIERTAEVAHALDNLPRDIIGREAVHACNNMRDIVVQLSSEGELSCTAPFGAKGCNVTELALSSSGLFQ